MYSLQSKDEQWQRAMEYVSLVSELNYMTQVKLDLHHQSSNYVRTYAHHSDFFFHRW